ncbi:peptide ABC transporter substrate-binding protein [Methanocalculus chunghsingensis]|uniref:Peptide ABC transporter substrate-binding protein n=1 Tax=Methanocalculus chunghsingensis TaxID=156457 RepID=A0A8J7W8R4_9EURY|nr:ABC transporter substrate-binding protein [Methanocalculus chunghsingensis]MBR1369563.1 peptide ABC transporter substrate-binding protein [Methanocalculus chunghsingensis]
MRIHTVGIVFVTVSILLTAGCVGGDPADHENVLRIGTPMEIKSQNVFGDYNLGIFFALSNPTLSRMNENGEIIGYLASHYTVSDDNRIWTFYIDDSFFWSDGTPVTPEDVAFSITTYGEKIPSARWIGENLDDILIGDNYVSFIFTQPYTTIDLEFCSYRIVPARDWESIDEPLQYTSRGPYTGSGPFYLDDINLQAGILTFERNQHWRGEEPSIDRIEVHSYSNIDSAMLALERGDVDTFYRYAGSYPYTGIQRLEATGNFDFIETTNVGLIFLGLNLKSAPTDDPAFREAIAYAINYEEIIRIDALGYGEVPNRGFVPPSMEFFRDTPPLSYNPAHAEALLDAAGYADKTGNGYRQGKDGEEIGLEILIRSEYARTGELIADYLNDIGVRTTIKTVDATTWFTLKDSYSYDLTITRTTPWGMYMHAGYGTGYFDSRRTGQGVLHYLDDPPFLELCDMMRDTTDPSLQREYAWQMQDYYAENLPGIALYWNKIVTPYNTAFTGWKTDPLYGIYNMETFVNIQRSGA